MNNLFKNGDYVLLEDCKDFDEKYGLEEDTTMWAVALKLGGGEPENYYMDRSNSDVCVGIFSDDTGIWVDLPTNKYATRLSVEDVLYRSQDGLTITELSKIPGAFEDGKAYVCVWSHEASYLETNSVYRANGKGIVDDNGRVLWIGKSSRLKPIVINDKWVPSVGDEVMDYCGKVIVKLIKDNQACVEFENGSIDVVQLSLLKPIDRERERIISDAFTVIPPHIFEKKDVIEHLYDAGMLKAQEETNDG